MNSEWPIRTQAPPAVPRAGLALRRSDAAGRRVADMATDLFLPDAHRVTDRVRASVGSMLDGVVGATERAMRRSIAPHFADRAELAASLASTAVDIAGPLLGDAQVLRHPPLVAILLRRAGEFVLAQRLAESGSAAGARGRGLPIDDDDPGTAEAAVSLLVAEARRIDRFGEAALLLDDLPAEIAHWLVWQIAAALRHYLCVHHDVGEREADPLITEAAASVLAGHDEGRGTHAIAAALVARLAVQGPIDGQVMAGLLASGQIAAFDAALANATAIPAEEVWNIVTDPLDGRLALLLRAAGVARADASEMLLLILVNADAATEIDFFDAASPQAARQALEPLALPGEYRSAIGRLDDALASGGARA